MMRMDFPTMHLYRLNHTDRNRIVDVLLQYYRLHIPQFPELKTDVTNWEATVMSDSLSLSSKS